MQQPTETTAGASPPRSHRAPITQIQHWVLRYAGMLTRVPTRLDLQLMRIEAADRGWRSRAILRTTGLRPQIGPPADCENVGTRRRGRTRERPRPPFRFASPRAQRTGAVWLACGLTLTGVRAGGWQGTEARKKPGSDVCPIGLPCASQCWPSWIASQSASELAPDGGASPSPALSRSPRNDLRDTSCRDDCSLQLPLGQCAWIGSVTYTYCHLVWSNSTVPSRTVHTPGSCATHPRLRIHRAPSACTSSRKHAPRFIKKQLAPLLMGLRYPRAAPSAHACTPPQDALALRATSHGMPSPRIAPY